MTGRTISHYQIFEKLGEGGMGAVYRARDTHLNRYVALKVLPPEKVADPERKRRFVQEAQSASALNHPNIVTVYDIDQEDGVDYIVMEHIQGRTLDRLIGRKGLKLCDALKYGVQIADALSRAHAAGIVHRDLKPANIMVTKDRHLVKVLDFGLAKLIAEDESGDLASTDTTQTYEPQTSEGKILGTVAYMSPEQAQGARVDARSDIFSFGSVLYEMLAGRPAFQGGTRMSVLSAVLHEEPKLLSEVVHGIPNEVEGVIGLCLRKDLTRRLQHMDDLKLVLDHLKEQCDTGTLGAAPDGRTGRRLSVRWPALAALVILVAALWIWWLVNPGVFDGTATLTRLTWDSGLTEDPALSPDGGLVAYASDRSGEGNLDIWVQQLSGGEPIRLTSNEADDVTPSFSPDGARITFRSDRDGGGIYTVSALGGQERLIARSGLNPSYSPDGGQIVYWVGEPANLAPSGRVYIVPVTTGKPLEFQPGFVDARYPIWTPDGKHILFQGLRSVGEEPDWWVAPVEMAGSSREQASKTGAFEVFRHGGLSVHMGPGGFRNGQILFSANAGNARNIYEVPISARSWKVTNRPQRLTFGTGIEGEPFPGPGGRLVLVNWNFSNNVWLLPLHEQGKTIPEIRRVTEGMVFHGSPSCSSDGQRIVFTSGRLGSRDVWFKDLGTGREMALTVTPSDEVSPVISPLGSKVAYSISGVAAQPIYVIDLTSLPGSALPEKVCDDCGEPVAWSADGSRIVYVYGRPRSVGLFTIASGQKTRLLHHSRYSLEQAQLSPDGAWISVVAYAEPDRTRVFVIPFRGGAAVSEDQWIPVTDGQTWDDRPRWSPDGKHLYFYSRRDGFGCIWEQALDRITRLPAGAPSAVRHFHSAKRSMMHMGLNTLGLSVAADHLIFNLLEQAGNVWVIQPKDKR
jgi:Tol biopolymer transport system component/predicted Ser/Thr protein kinase